MAKQLMYSVINFVHVLKHRSFAQNFLPKEANQQYLDTCQLPANTSSSSFATQLGGEAMGIRTENEQLEPGLGVEHHGTSRIIGEKWYEGQECSECSRYYEVNMIEFQMLQVALDWCDGRLWEGSCISRRMWNWFGTLLFHRQWPFKVFAGLSGKWTPPNQALLCGPSRLLLLKGFDPVFARSLDTNYSGKRFSQRFAVGARLHFFGGSSEAATASFSRIFGRPGVQSCTLWWRSPWRFDVALWL